MQFYNFFLQINNLSFILVLQLYLTKYQTNSILKNKKITYYKLYALWCISCVYSIELLRMSEVILVNNFPHDVKAKIVTLKHSPNYNLRLLVVIISSKVNEPL